MRRGDTDGLLIANNRMDLYMSVYSVRSIELAAFTEVHKRRAHWYDVRADSLEPVIVVTIDKFLLVAFHPAARSPLIGHSGIPGVLVSVTVHAMHTVCFEQSIR